MPQVFTEKEKELAKFEQFPQDVPRGLQPGNPWRPGNDFGKAGAHYPKMLYRAKQQPNGKYAVAMTAPHRYGFATPDDWMYACQFAEQFTEGCRRIVNSEAEQEAAEQSGEGWRETQAEALAFAAALEKAMGDAAAERNWQDRNMSDRAKAEVAAAEASHFGHLPEIPEQKPGRKGKKVTADVPAS